MVAKSWLELGNELAQLALLLLGSPLLAGVHQNLRARWSGETPGPVLREYHELWRLLGKDGAFTTSASFVTAAAPFGLIGLVGFAASLTPLFSPTPVGGLGGDLLVIFGLWLASKAWLSVSAIEGQVSTTSFAASRAMSLLVLIFPAFLLCWLAVLGPAGNSAPFFVEAPEAGTPASYKINLAQMLALFSFAIILLTEVSPQATRTEMEGVFGGRLLALIRYSSQIWRFVWYALFAVYFIPPSLGATTLLSAGLNISKVLLLTMIYAMFEARLARKKFFTYHEYAAIALGLAFLANASLALGG
jgi:formate hydrogenlyase subunit 4